MSFQAANQVSPPVFSTLFISSATFAKSRRSLDLNLEHSRNLALDLKCKYFSMASNPGSGASTPNPRFTPQAKTAEDLLSTQTVGLVALSDFRKRRAEALEQKERDAQELLSGGSGRGTPGTVTPDG